MSTGTSSLPVSEHTAEDPLRPRAMQVTQVVWEADGVLSLQLVDPERGELPGWTPGAHLDLVLPSGTVRQYSLCGDESDHAHYRVAVLHEPLGRGGSQEVHDTQLVGKTVAVLGPRNRFELVEAPHYLFIAGGIGITPILSMVRAVARKGLPWRLVYGGRSLESMAFRTEVTALAESGNGSVVFLPQDEHGHPDLESEIAAAGPKSVVYTCGPEGLLQAVADCCAARMPEGALHFERFSASPEPGSSGSALHAVGEQGEESADSFEVELAQTGKVVTVPPDRSVLSAVEEVCPDVLSSCEEGYCGTCETRVLKGEPDHRDSILNAKERKRSATMFICVSRSNSPRLTLDL